MTTAAPEPVTIAPRRQRRSWRPEPRMGWGRVQVAAYLGRSVAWLDRHRDSLQAAGFPAPHPLLGWDRAALDRWIDGLTGGLDPAATRADHAAALESRMLERLRHGPDRA